MHSLILIIVLAIGHCEAVHWQKLSCPYEEKHRNLQRVWCRQSSEECCTGLTFGQDSHMVDGGNLKVTQGQYSFTVEVLELNGREGMYWCGLLSRNNTIIKLGEGYLHSSFLAYIWNYMRWSLLPVLPMVTIFTSVYSRASIKKRHKGPEEPDDDMVTRNLQGPPMNQ